MTHIAAPRFRACLSHPKPNVKLIRSFLNAELELSTGLAALSMPLPPLWIRDSWPLGLIDLCHSREDFGPLAKG